MKMAAPMLLPLLRSRTQGNIFARLFLDPDNERSISELAEEVAASASSVLREVNRLEAAGLVTTTRRGHSRLIRVHQDNPVFAPMAALMAVTFGAVPVIKAALRSMSMGSKRPTSTDRGRPATRSIRARSPVTLTSW